jgi:nitrogen fixation protein NifZ
MALNDLQPGDVIYAATTLHNDGGVPGMEGEALLARPGTRGVLINIGHPEEDPNETIYLVRFEDEQKNLGLPVGCLPEELTDDPATIAP